MSKAKHAVAIAEGGRGGEVRYFGEAFPARRHRNIVAVTPNRDGPVIVNKRHLSCRTAWLKTKAYSIDEYELLGVEREAGKPAFALMAERGTDAMSARLSLP
ncbi:hypothetical protein [Mesorhizobium sp.]|uniref:hypothetical protein n=1 Tax=Mesorhizobium sp. TaxID=1871066 RepID=UPI00257F39CC|nr:hypothetical protein [Mesorhizobium sp.]